MSVEIKELVIRASVSERATEKSSSEYDDAESGSAAAKAPDAATVRAAVQEVLRILKASKER